jgi:hypothetical protein
MSGRLNEPEDHPVIVEVESNENCEASVFSGLKETGPAQPVAQGTVYGRNSSEEWYWGTGSSDSEAKPMPSWLKIQEVG